MKLINPTFSLYFFLIILVASGIVFPTLLPHDLGFYLFILVLSLGGLGVTTYIRKIKAEGGQLVCPVGSDCNVVVNSKYSKFFEVSLEYWGMLYYTFIFLSYLSLILAPQIFTDTMILLLSFATTGAFLFSLYLIFVQAYLLKEWCIWCLLSAFISVGIFLISLGSVAYTKEILFRALEFTSFFHSLGFALGVGGVTIATFMFNKFLSDKKIENNELSLLKIVSETIFIGLIFVIVSNFIVIVAFPTVLSSSPSFLAETIVILIAGISGAVLMIIFTPLLSMIPFGEEEEGSSFKSLEKPFFVISAISAASWYFAFVSSYINSLSFLQLLFIYLATLFIAVAISLSWENRLKCG